MKDAIEIEHLGTGLAGAPSNPPASPADPLCDTLGITDPQARSAINGIASARHLKKGEYLLQAGETPHYVAFPEKGVLRCYYLNAAGSEVTSCLACRIDMPCIVTTDIDAPSIESIQALTPCDLICLDMEGLLGLVATCQPVTLAYIKILECAWRMQWSLRIVSAQLDARGRYLWFLENFPGVIDAIPHYYIASFLSITPVTLSRVRRALREEAEESGGGSGVGGR